MGRDNFTKATIDVLAKRVGYLCSNPNCKKFTIGPHDSDVKATLIGIASHITAASPGGPRFDQNISDTERKHINNAIWLCSNCATLIDKNENDFPVNLLNDWKQKAEDEMRNAILGEYNSSRIEKVKLKPFIEADLIFSSSIRSPRGHSPKNYEKFGGNIIPAGAKMIIFWELTWNFSFVLHNNSKFPAYNISIEYLRNDIKFNTLSKLPKVNNLPPYANLDLRASYSQFIEGIHTEADEVIAEKIPNKLNGLELKINYEDDERNLHSTLLQIKDKKIKNIKE